MVLFIVVLNLLFVLEVNGCLLKPAENTAKSIPCLVHTLSFKQIVLFSLNISKLNLANFLRAVLNYGRKFTVLESISTIFHFHSFEKPQIHKKIPDIALIMCTFIIRTKNTFILGRFEKHFNLHW